MFILTKEDIEYCVGIKKSGGQENNVSGLIYNQKFFIKAKHYDISEIDEAIKDCRENFLDNQELQLPTLVIKEADSVSIWVQNNSYQAQSSPNTNKAASPVKAKASNSFSLEKLADKMRNSSSLTVKTRRYKLKLYHHCFVGSEAVDWLSANLKISREKAVKLGQQLVKAKIIYHVKNEHDFEDGELFYRFYKDEEKNIWTDKVI